MGMIRLALETNAPYLALTAVVFFILGLLLAFSTALINREGRKNGFTHRFVGRKDKELDKRMLEDYKEAKKNNELYHTQNDVEHHASKKFK